jgi:hypothetical protein
VVLTLGAPGTVQPGLTPTSTPTQSLGPAPTAAPRFEAPAPAPNEPATFPAGCLADPDILGLDLSTGGAPLPASLTLTAADWGPCYVLLADEGGFEINDIGRPDVCLDNRPYGANTGRVAGRTREYTMGPETNAYETVVQYAPGQAAAFMAEVQARVGECATHPLAEGSGYALILDSDFAGDESLLVYRGENPEGGYPGLITVLIRVGDLVIVMYHGGDQGVDRERDLTMARKAVAYLG